MDGLVGVIIWIIVIALIASSNTKKKQQQKKSSPAAKPQPKGAVEKPQSNSASTWAEIKRMMQEELESVPPVVKPQNTPVKPQVTELEEQNVLLEEVATEGSGRSIMEAEPMVALPLVPEAMEPERLIPNILAEGECHDERHQHGKPLTSRIKSKADAYWDEQRSLEPNVPGSAWAKAIVMAEILGEPVARKQAGYFRKHHNMG